MVVTISYRQYNRICRSEYLMFRNGHTTFYYLQPQICAFIVPLTFPFLFTYSFTQKILLHKYFYLPLYSFDPLES